MLLYFVEIKLILVTVLLTVIKYKHIKDNLVLIEIKKECILPFKIVFL